ncbi:MAG: hypothetical protein JWQ90_1717 [Hydrocarboniphaga sp.]|nr:hypothetical protein [Hydrocarboniphaga sp.]
MLLVASLSSLLAATPAGAASPAASACPDYFFLSDNLASNPGFEIPTADVAVGDTICWTSGDPSPPPSAAEGWTMHSSNAGAKVCSKLVPSKTPGPHGEYMLMFKAGGNEGGVYQALELPPDKAYMFSVWVYVKKGQVAIQSNTTTGGPVAWTSKIGEWEQLRVCTNSEYSTNALVIANEDPDGGQFYVDRAELREIPIRE